MRLAALIIFASLAVCVLRRAVRSRRSIVARRRLEKLESAERRGAPGEGSGRPRTLPIARFCALIDRAASARGIRSAVDLGLPGASWRLCLVAWMSGTLLAGPLAAALTGNLLAPPVVVFLAACSPLALPRLLAGRVARLQREGLDRFAADVGLMLQCGLPVEDAFEVCTQNAAGCVRGALERLCREMQMGGDPPGAIRKFAAGCASDDLRLVTGAAAAAGETGADMRPVMAGIGEAVRERAGIRRELHAQTAQGRASGRVVSALPLLFLAVSALVSRGTLSVLFGSWPGLVMLASAVALDAAGFLWIRKILDIEV